MQESQTETLAFRTFGPQSGQQLTAGWGEQHNKQPLQVLAVAGDRFCAAGPGELVFGCTRDLHHWAPSEFVRVPLDEPKIIRGLASREFVVAHDERVTVFGPTGERGWSAPVNQLKSLNAHPRNARFSYCDASGGHICGDGKIKTVPATHIIWNQDGTKMAKINGTKLTLGDDQTEFPETIEGAGFIGSKLLAAGADKKYIWDGQKVEEAPEIVGPFGNEDRLPLWYVQPLPGWPIASSSLTVVCFSQGSDIVLVDEGNVFEPSDDDARAVMPFDDDTCKESAPCGAAIDWTSTSPVAKPFAGVTDCPASPILYVLDDMGKLLAWSVVSKEAIREETVFEVVGATAGISLPDVEPTEPVAEAVQAEKPETESEPEPKEQPKEQLTGLEQTEPEPKEQPAVPEPKEQPIAPESEAPEAKVQNSEVEDSNSDQPKTELKTEPEVEETKEPAREPAKEPIKEPESKEAESKEAESKEPELKVEETKEPEAKEPEAKEPEAVSQPIASQHAAPIASRHAAPASAHSAFGKPSALGSFSKPLDAKFGNTQFVFNTGGNLFSQPKAKETKEVEETKKPQPKEPATAKENPFASFTNKSMLDAVKLDKPPARPKPDFFSVNVDPGAGDITTTSTQGRSESEGESEGEGEGESESESEKDYSRLDISDRFGGFAQSGSGSEPEGESESEESESDQASESESQESESQASESQESQESDLESDSSSLVHVESEINAENESTPAPSFSFGQAKPFGFSQTNKSAFGSSAQASAFGSSNQASAFGSSNQASAFGSATFNSGLFGQPKPAEAEPEAKDTEASLQQLALEPEEPEEQKAEEQKAEEQKAEEQKAEELKASEPEEPNPRSPSPPPFDNINSTQCESATSMLPLQPQLFPQLADLDRVYAETNSLFQVLDNNLQVLAEQANQEKLTSEVEPPLMEFDSWHLADAGRLAATIAEHEAQVDELAARVPAVESAQPLLNAIELAVSDMHQLGAALKTLHAPASAHASIPIKSLQLQFKLRQQFGTVKAMLQQAEEQLAFARVQRGEIPSKADLNLAVDIISRKIYALTEKYPDILHNQVDMRAFASDMHDLSLAPPDAFDRKKFINLNNRARQLKRLGRRLQTVSAESVIS